MGEEYDNIRSLSKIINNVLSFLELPEIKIFSHVNKYCNKMSKTYMINNFYYRYYGQELSADVKNLILTKSNKWWEKFPDAEKIIFHKSYDDEKFHIAKKVTNMEVDTNIQETIEIFDCLSYLKLPKSVDSFSNVLPNSLTHLIFHRYSIFDKSIEGLLPDSLQVLDLGFKFNQPIFSGEKSFLPPNLIKLIFSFEWNHPIHDGKYGYLPPKLKYLNFGFSFNNTISLGGKSFLPETLTYLDLGIKFNHSINPLPNSLLTLKVSSHFERQIFSLPSKLINLELKGHYKHNLRRGVIPNSLRNLSICGFDGILNEFNLGKITSLTIEGLNNHRNISSIPETVNKLIIYSSVQVEYLPSYLTYLFFNPSSSEQINMIPDSVKYLHMSISRKVNGSVNKLPNSLEGLFLYTSSHVKFDYAVSKCQNLVHLRGYMFINTSEDRLPSSLNRLFVSFIENETIKYLPKSLKHIASEFESLNPGELPPNLISLIIKRCNFDQEILPGTFPESLQRLTISSKLNHVLNKENLPPKLLSLTLGQEFNQDLNDLPDSLMELILPFDYDRPLTNLPKSLYHLRLNMKHYEGVKFNIPVLEDLEGKCEELCNWTP